jgi:hypothetical protein
MAAEAATTIASVILSDTAGCAVRLLLQLPPFRHLL